MDITDTITSWAAEDRPREKLLSKGREELTVCELLAILIGTGYGTDNAMQLARKAFDLAGGNLVDLSRMPPESFKSIVGLGGAKVARILAALELGKRRLAFNPEEKPKISNSRDLYAAIRDVLTDLEREQFWVIYMNRANRVIHREQISKGGVSGTVVDIKLVFRTAVTRLASCIALCHNHPSGTLQPSGADIALTRKAIMAGRVLDVAVVDHLIVTDGGYYSFSDEGRMHTD